MRAENCTLSWILLGLPALLNPHPPTASSTHTPLLILQSAPANFFPPVCLPHLLALSLLLSQPIRFQPAHSATHMSLVCSLTLSIYTNQVGVVLSQNVVCAPACFIFVVCMHYALDSFTFACLSDLPNCLMFEWLFVFLDLTSGLDRTLFCLKPSVK